MIKCIKCGIILDMVKESENQYELCLNCLLKKEKGLNKTIGDF